MHKDCPLCGERMHQRTREQIARVPGTTHEVRTTAREWACRECDYVEDADDRMDD